MGEPALKPKPQIAKEPKSIPKIEDNLLSTHTEELIIGLCGPIGTDISFVATVLEDVIKRDFNYACRRITLSDFIKKLNPAIDFEKFRKKPVTYYEQLIDHGNELRHKNNNSVLSGLAINDITIQREIKRKPEENFESQRVCYIIDSIKNIEELELFKLVYRDIFYFIGVFSSVESRKTNLQSKGMKAEDVYHLFDRDSGEEITFGQKVSQTFMEADLFIRMDKSTAKSIEPKIKRFLNLIFETDIVTPSPHETAMYLAAAAAGNSACLSRQVGASITDDKGEIISVGWNDVPKFGGSVYQYSEKDPTSIKDHRCMNMEGGICFNDREKQFITKLLVDDLIEKGIVDESKTLELIKAVRSSKISEIIEFSRAIHAEMLAIIHGCQKAGQKMKNGILYCTTYPCHNCARHIVAAGIREVYYIEPYRKSLALKLHYDSITEDEGKENMVKILMYEGVAPGRYLELFRMSSNSRKKNGKKIPHITTSQKPRNTLSLQAIPILEKEITKDLRNRKLI